MGACKVEIVVPRDTLKKIKMRDTGERYVNKLDEFLSKGYFSFLEILIIINF